MRAIALAILALVAAGSALFAYGALANLWADYQDSPTATYLEIGLTWVALSVWAVAVAVSILRRR
jgi:hypothetical protein